jgi:hypothetical protein
MRLGQLDGSRKPFFCKLVPGRVWDEGRGVDTAGSSFSRKFCFSQPGAEPGKLQDTGAREQVVTDSIGRRWYPEKCAEKYGQY